MLLFAAMMTLLGTADLVRWHIAWPSILGLGVGLNTLEVYLAQSARSVRMFDARVLMIRAGAITLGGPVLLVLAGPTWLVPILLTTTMVSTATHLGVRTLGTLLVFTSLSYAATSWLIDAGSIDVIQPTRVGGQVSLGWSLVVAGAFIPGATLFSAVRTWADERKRRELQQTVEELRGAEDSLRASQQAAERASVQLAVEVERKTHQLERRNRSLSIVNAVSFALSEPVEDDYAIRRAARLIARLLALRSVEVREAASATTAAESVVVGPRTEGDALPRLPPDLIDEVAHGGESIVSVVDSEELAAVGVDQPYVIVPMVTQGQVRGALRLIGEVVREWGDEERHLLPLLGREFGAATESGRLYREAVAKAKREELVTRVAAAVTNSGSLHEQLTRALALLGETLHPVVVALLSVPGDATEGHELARWIASDRAADWGEQGFQDALHYLGVSAGSIAGSELLATDDPRLAGLAPGGGAVVVSPLVTQTVAADTDELTDADLLHGASQSTTGLLVVAAAPGRGWAPEDIELISRLAEVVARRLDAEQLVQLQRRRFDEMAGLAEVGRAVQSGADADRLYSAFAVALARLVPYERMYIARLEQSDLVDLAMFDAGGEGTERGEFRCARLASRLVQQPRDVALESNIG